MPPTATAVQPEIALAADPATDVDAVVKIENVLVRARKRAGQSIRETREAKRISLTAAARAVRISPSTLSELERGHSWESKTAMKVVRFLGRVA